MSLRARATAFCVCSFHRTIIRKVPHKNVVKWRKVPHKSVVIRRKVTHKSVVIRQKVPHESVVIRRKVPHKNVKYLFLSLIISIFASCKTNDNLLWNIAVR